MRIAILPLDDRPQTYGFTAPLCAIGGVEPLLPPRELLGYFLTPGDTAALSAWLLEAAAKADAVVIAVDQLVFGGLIASRSPRSVTKEEALQRLDLLRTIRQRHPNQPLFAATVLMRASITASDKDSVHWWRLVHRWSEIHEPANAAEAQEKAQIEAELPPSVLAEYKEARARNHAVNRACLDLAADGVLDYVLVSQEDCTERGPHRTEQQLLLAHAATLDIAGRYTLCTGADEAAHVLLARAVLNLRGQAPRIDVVWSDPAGASRVAPFEDRPVQETVAGLVGAAGAALDQRADLTLFVHPPNKERTDLVAANEASPSNTDAFIASLEQAASAGRPCAVADVWQANGGDPGLTDRLRHMSCFSALYGYAAWNTCANTVGTVLAQALLRLSAGAGSDDRSHHAFLLERLADDGLYQIHVRTAVNRWLKLREQFPWGLPPEQHRETEEAVRALLAPMIRDLHRDLFGHRYSLESIQIGLRWPRIFEATVNVTLTEVAE